MVFAVTAAVVGGAIGKSNQKKAYERSKRDADLQRIIDGSSTSISAAEGVDPESFQIAGTEAADIDKAIEQSYYGGTPPSEEILAVPEEVPPEELAMLLQSNPELFQDQGIMGMASGGAVGTPEDVYYFGVPQIMGMMQDPNPQIQGVGMQLADQMSTMPDAGMVPATANQIQTMAMGGAVTAKKYRDGTQGGIENYDPELDAEFIAEQEAFEELLELDELVDKGVISQARADFDRQRLLGKAFRVDRSDPIKQGQNFTDLDREFLKGSYRKKANGGPITSERLNQLRRR
jgi:hypothetical protein